ncbi:MAG: plastocyanin/azurin family copper-binding protein [Gaiellaceae bacterium]
MTRRILTILLVLAALGLGAAACGGDDNGEAEEPAANGGGGQTIQIAADPDGALAYDTTELTAQAGEITIEFTNESSMPHDVTLEGVEGGATDVITEDTASVTVTLEPGTYTFFCSVAGHRAAGMEGTLTVE